MITLTFADLDMGGPLFLNPAQIVNFFQFDGKTHIFTVLHDSSPQSDDEGIVVTETPTEIMRLITQEQMFFGTAGQ